MTKCLLSISLISALFLAGACGTTGAQVIQGGAVTAQTLIGCEPDEQSAVENAIRNGGVNWISVVLDSIGCVWKVYQGLKGSGLVADNGDTLPLSQRARRRLTTSLRLQQLIVK